MVAIIKIMFDAILYINLEHRKDRKESVIEEISKLSHITTNIHRINGVLHKLCGHIGCARSHINALQLAIENQWNSVLIVEDDLEVVGDLSVLDKIDKIKWDVMLLGYAHNNNKPSKYNFLVKVNGSTTTIGYIIRKHYYETLLGNFKESLDIMEEELKSHIKKYEELGEEIPKLHYCTAIDQHWFKLQDKDIFYAFKPKIGIPKSIFYSDNNCTIEHQARILHQSEQS